MTQRWTRQPQYRATLDKSHPLANQLVFAAEFGANFGTDIAGGIRPSNTVGAPTLAPVSGPAMAGAFSSAVLGYGDVELLTTNKATWQLIVLPDNWATQVAGLIDKRDTSTSNNAWSMGLNYGLTNRFRVDIGAGTSTASGYDFSASGWSVGEPSNIIVAVDSDLGAGNRIKLWRNGAQIALLSAIADTAFAAFNNSTSPIEIGRVNNSTLYYAGKIICARIWDRYLNTDEIAALSVNPWQIFTPISRRSYFSVSAGGATVIDLTSAAFGFTGNSNQPAVRSSLTQASFDFISNPIQPKTTVGLTAAAFNFTANAINLGGQTIIDLSRASFNFTANAINVIKDTVINLTTAAFNFVGKVINISTPPIPGGSSGGGMFMALAGFFKKRRYRQKVGKHE